MVTSAMLEFAAAATLLILAPGPDSILVMRNAMRGGRRLGLFTAAGTVTGLLGWGLAAALGLSSLVAASRIGYDVLRFSGAAYLIWLGVISLISRRRSSAEQVWATVPRVSARRAHANGVISNLCNPKIGAFFIAFLPGFIPAGGSVRELSGFLSVWFAIETGIWLVILVTMVDRGVGWFGRSTVQRRLERLTGLVLIGFGIRLATETR